MKNEPNPILKTHSRNYEPELSVLFYSSIIIEPLTYICNLSFQTGLVPDELKRARIVPVYKKGDRSVITNYRPISLLSVFHKILEKLMCSRLNSFF